MSLFKVPFILSSAIAVQVSLTAPNTSPNDTEVVHHTFNERVICWAIKYGLPYAKGLYWGISLAEIALISSHAVAFNAVISMMQRMTGLHLGRIQDTPITPAFLFGTTLVITGGLIRLWCFRTLGRFFTFELSVRKGHQLVTTGPYAIVRHPSYTGATLQFIGVVIVYGSRTSWLRESGVLSAIPALKSAVLLWLVERTIIAVSLLLRVSQEEEVVKSHFGDEWKRWAKVVRYRLIPGIY